MKKNSERIIEYLSGKLNEDEKKFFENELNTSVGLKKEFDDLNSKLLELSSVREIKTNETYFSNLIPRVYQKLETEKKLWSFKKVYYLIPTATAVIVLFLFSLNSNNDYNLGYHELASQVVNNISDQEVSEKYSAELESDPGDYFMADNSGELNVQLPADIDLKNDAYTRLVGNPLANEYSTLQNLSDDELEIVYEKLNSTTSQKVQK